MKKLFGTILAALAVGIVLTGCPGGKSGNGDAIELKFNLQKGNTYTYGMKTHFDIDMEMMGKEMKTSADMDFGFNMKVDDVDAAGNRLMSTTYDAIRFKMNAMGMDMGYDSKNVGDTSKENIMQGMFRKIFGGMLGKTFKMTMSPKGEITKVEGMKELTESMLNNMDLPEAEKEQARKQMEQSFSEDQIKQSFGQGFGFYPDKPVKVGDSWNKTLERDMSNMKMNIETKYTVKEIKDAVVILETKGVIKANGSDSVTVAKMDMSGDMKGIMEIDRSSGMAQKGNMDMDIKITIPGMSKPMAMKANITIEGKKQ